MLCRFSSLNVSTKYEQKEIGATSESLLADSENENMTMSAAYSTTKQIISNKNFLSFVIMNFFQVISIFKHGWLSFYVRMMLTKSKVNLFVYFMSKWWSNINNA